MTDLNAVHPFREGNGRTQRTFMRELAQQAGHTLDFSVVSRERMIQASIAGNDYDDRTMMRRLFTEISDPERVAALSKAIGDLEQHGFAWNDRYIATMEPGHRIDAKLAGIAGDQFMARTQTAILIGKASDLPEQRPDKGQEFTLIPTPWGKTRKPEAEQNIDWRR
jgi:cell filamentation protein